MSIKQKINIDFDWALLTISAEIENIINQEWENVDINTLTFSSTKNGSIEDDDFNLKIDFENIPKSNRLDNFTPIQFLESDDVNLYLLEETDYTLIFELKSSNVVFNQDDLFKELIFHKPETFKFDEIKDNIFVVNFNFRSHVGRTFIDLFNENVKFNLPIEIRSRKINYERDYPRMISDLAKYSSSLFFDINSSLFHNYEKYDKKRETKYEDYMLLEYIFREEKLPSVFEYLSKNLYSNLTTVNEEVPISFAFNINDNELINIVSSPNNVIEVNGDNFLFEFKGRKFSPMFIDEVTYEDNIDVPENRFYKYFLEYLKYLVLDLKNDDQIAYHIKTRLNTFENRINYYLSQHYFEKISKMDYIPFNSQVLQKKEGYRELLEYYLMLDVGFKINCDLITNQIKGYEKRLSKIYEYWCFFKLNEIISNLTHEDVNFDNFVNDNWELTLERGFINEFNYKLENDEIVVLSLAYNQEFAGYESNIDSVENIFRSYSLDMFPDFTVSIKYHEKVYFVHFDAKYKVKNGKVKSEDIHKMHTYKDSIEGSIGSFVLFPGNSNSKKIFNGYGNNLSYVGAFPLNPLNNDAEKDEIENNLISIINKLPEL